MHDSAPSRIQVIQTSNPMTGRFWASDSESDCDELGDEAESSSDQATGVESNSQLPTVCKKIVHFSSSEETRRLLKKTAASPPGIRWPWTKAWKGPLPKITKREVTLADFLPSPSGVIASSIDRQLSSRFRRVDAAAGAQDRQDPLFLRLPYSNKDGLLQANGPAKYPKSKLSVAWLRRQLNPSSWLGTVAGDRRSFAAVTMAGGGIPKDAGRGQDGGRSGMRQLNDRVRGAGRDRGGRRGRGRLYHGPVGSRGVEFPAGKGGQPEGSNRGGRGGGRGAGMSRDGHSVGHGHNQDEIDQAGNQASDFHERHEGDEPAAKKKKVLRCSICSEEHFTNKCPLLHGPKPYATYCGLAGDGLVSFIFPQME